MKDSDRTDTNELPNAGEELRHLQDLLKKLEEKKSLIKQKQALSETQ